MRLESRLCFLVLVISSVSRGQSQTTVASQGHDLKEKAEDASTPSQPLNEAKDEANSSTVSTATNQSLPSVDTVSTPEARTLSPNGDDPLNETTTQGSTSQVPSSVRVTTVPATTVPVATVPVTTVPVVTSPTSFTAGYVILVMMIVVIIVLCVILYFLRRVSRTYSFDLQRPGPVDHLSLPIGTFEPVYLDDLERPTPKEITEEDPPAANGTNLHSEEKTSTEQNAAQEHPDVNGLETSATSNTSNTSVSQDADPVEPLDSPSLMFSDAGEQQNENNNNPSVCSMDPFVEINLDEPAWCDQLLTSPEAPSSVLPFSPFSV